MATLADEAPAPSTRVSRAGWYALTLVSTAQGLSLLDRQILRSSRPTIRPTCTSAIPSSGCSTARCSRCSTRCSRSRSAGWSTAGFAPGCCRFRIFAWSLFCALSAFAGGFALLAFSRLGVGIGEASAQPSANSIIFDTFPRSRRGTAMAAMGITTSLGLGFSMALGGVVAQWWDGRFPNHPGGFSGWQFAFLVASLPGLLLAWLISRLREPMRGEVDGIVSPPDPHPFKASGAVLASVTPGINWLSLWSRKAAARQWAVNLVGLLMIFLFCRAMTASPSGSRHARRPT